MQRGVFMWGDFCEIYLPANDKSDENKKNKR